MAPQTCQARKTTHLLVIVVISIVMIHVLVGRLVRLLDDLGREVVGVAHQWIFSGRRQIGVHAGIKLADTIGGLDTSWVVLTNHMLVGHALVPSRMRSVVEVLQCVESGILWLALVDEGQQHGIHSVGVLYDAEIQVTFAGLLGELVDRETDMATVTEALVACGKRLDACCELKRTPQVGREKRSKKQDICIR